MKNVSAAIIRKSYSILLTRRAPGEKLAGFWEFPGGKQEEGESILECMERELREELNIECEAIDVFTENVYEYTGGSINLIAINTKIVSGEIKLSVHDRYEWVQLPELLDYKLAPADIAIAERIVNHGTC